MAGTTRLELATSAVTDIKRCRRTSFDTTRYRMSLLIVPLLYPDFRSMERALGIEPRQSTLRRPSSYLQILGLQQLGAAYSLRQSAVQAPFLLMTIMVSSSSGSAPPRNAWSADVSRVPS